MNIVFITKFEYLEPVGIMALSAFLKRHGHRCELVDIALEKDCVATLQRLNPGIIAYSVTTGRHQFYQQLNQRLKQSMSFFAVFGGPHPTFFPDFIHEDGVDAICRGEGEHALLELVEALAAGNDYTQIPNIWTKKDGRVCQNELRPLIENLDELPFIDRDLVNKYAHYRKMRRRMVLTGRGCPYDCSYCFNHVYNDLYKGKGTLIRKRSVGHVLRELAAVRDLCHPRRVQFIDDTFILNRDWCREFCVRYKQEIGLPFIAYTRVNLVTDDVVRSLADAGCVTILYAIESGNDYIRNKVLDRNIREEQIRDAVRLYKKHGLRTYAQNMVGIPGETLSMALDTLKLNIACRPDYAWCSIFQPYPGTKLWHLCRDQGYLTDMPFDESYYRHSILNIKNRRHIENLHHLFALTVTFPFLMPLTRMLLPLPLGALYFAVWNIHRLWCYVTKVKWIDIDELFIRE